MVEKRFIHLFDLGEVAHFNPGNREIIIEMILKMKKFFLYLFALVGVLSIVLSGYRAYRFEKVARTYLKRCHLVEEGMTLNQAREIIGDLKFEAWTQDRLSGEIILWNSGGDDVKFALEYPMVFAGSDNMRVFFDPNTLVVTRVSCDE